MSFAFINAFIKTNAIKYREAELVSSRLTLRILKHHYNSKLAISFSAYMNFGNGQQPGFKAPLSTTMGYEKWHPKHGWIARGFGWCGTGLGSFTLKPGASIRVMLNHPYEGDGIYRFRMHISGLGKNQPTSTFTKPVLISKFRPVIEAAFAN